MPLKSKITLNKIRLIDGLVAIPKIILIKLNLILLNRDQTHHKIIGYPHQRRFLKHKKIREHPVSTAAPKRVPPRKTQSRRTPIGA